MTLGRDSGDGWIDVRSGLAEGERVVTSSQFLIDSESKLQEAVQKLLSAGNDEAGATPSASPMPGMDIKGSAMPGMNMKQGGEAAMPAMKMKMETMPGMNMQGDGMDSMPGMKMKMKMKHGDGGAMPGMKMPAATAGSTESGEKVQE